MTEPTESALLDMATPYGLNALLTAERSEVERQLAAATTPLAAAFDEEVRAVRETMAVVSAATAVQPPARLRASVLAAVQSDGVRHSRWRTAIYASAAAIAVGLGAFGIGVALRPSATPTIADQVLAAPDVRTVSGRLGAGTATVMFSRNRNAGVLVMNNVAPPSPGSVYQMWLVGAQGATSAGTMDTKTVTPSTTAVISGLANSTALAFTVEPGAGSPQPTGTIFAQLPLS